MCSFCCLLSSKLRDYGKPDRLTLLLIVVYFVSLLFCQSWFLCSIVLLYTAVYCMRGSLFSSGFLCSAVFRIVIKQVIIIIIIIIIITADSMSALDIRRH